MHCNKYHNLFDLEVKNKTGASLYSILYNFIYFPGAQGGGPGHQGPRRVFCQDPGEQEEEAQRKEEVRGQMVAQNAIICYTCICQSEVS